VLAYTMVAERDNQRVTKQRTSALILLANARVWASEGWQVVITDADGKALDSAGFENWLGPVEASPLQPISATPLEELQEQNLSVEAELPAEDSEESRQAEEMEDARSEELELEEVEPEELESEDHYESLDALESAYEDQDFSEASGSLT
jgi:hypothetical protein